MKPDDVKIIQFQVIETSQGIFIYGLGDDGKIYSRGLYSPWILRE